MGAGRGWVGRIIGSRRRVALAGAYLRAMARRDEGAQREVEITPLSTVLAQLAGQWVAVDRVSNEPVAAASTPDKLAMEIRTRGLRNVSVVRAPDPSEPELVGLG